MPTACGCQLKMDSVHTIASFQGVLKANGKRKPQVVSLVIYVVLKEKWPELRPMGRSLEGEK